MDRSDLVNITLQSIGACIIIIFCCCHHHQINKTIKEPIVISKSDLEVRPDHCHRQSRQSCSPPAGSPAIIIFILLIPVIIIFIIILLIILVLVVMFMAKGSFDGKLKFKKSSPPDMTNTKLSKYSTQSKLKNPNLNVSEGEKL